MFPAPQDTTAISKGLAKTAPLSSTPSPAPDLPLEAAAPGITVSLLETSSPPPSSWGSPPPPMSASHRVTGPLTTQKLQDLLRDLQDVLQSVADLGGMAHAKEPSGETKVPEDGSEVQDAPAGPGKTEGTVSKTLLLCFDLEEKQGAKKQGLTLESQKPNSTGHLSARTWEKPSEESSALSKAQLRKEEGAGSPGVPEEGAKLQHNLGQLLGEAEHWSRQHAELGRLLRSYRRARRGRRAAAESHGARPRSQQHGHTCAGRVLQAAARRLSQDTHCLHLRAALLEEDCQILRHKVLTLDESYQPWEGTSPEKPPQRNQPSTSSQTSLEVERGQSSLPWLRGAFPKKDPVHRSSDPCLNRKAHNNQLNTRVARGLRGRKRPTSGFREEP